MLSRESSIKTDGRILSVEVVDFPEYIRGLASESDESEKCALCVQNAEEEWGAKPKKRPTSTAQLPRSLAGLTLGMSKGQILAVYPDPGGRSRGFKAFTG
jgi:hypothetical protein